MKPRSKQAIWSNEDALLAGAGAAGGGAAGRGGAAAAAEGVRLEDEEGSEEEEEYQDLPGQLLNAGRVASRVGGWVGGGRGRSVQHRSKANGRHEAAWPCGLR